MWAIELGHYFFVQTQLKKFRTFNGGGEGV